jgi:acetylornithine deacetylase/succinyl-diaminopimelate desuccinylase-like protein
MYLMRHIARAPLALAAALCLLLAATSRATTYDAPYQRQALDIYRHVIGFKTEIGEGQVPVMAQYLAEQLRAAGFPSDDIHVLPLGETASLVVRYRGSGTGGKPILMIAHMDVVTAKPEDWQRNPFELTESDGFFFGRGSYDVKVGVVCITEAFLRLKAEGFVPTRDLILAFSGDEETAGKTADDLVKNHRDLVDAEFVLNSDAGGGVYDEEDGHAKLYELQTAEKTFSSFELTVHNPGGHSSRPRRDNAIYELADALEKVRPYQFPVMWTPETREYFRVMAGETMGPIRHAMAHFAADPKNAEAAAALAKDPSYAGMTRTTCVPTLLRGGHADNALPQSATATINCRIFPGMPTEQVRDKLQELVGDKVEVRISDPGAVSDASPLRADVLAAVTRVVHSLHPGIPIVPTMEMGATDGVFYRSGGLPTYGTSEVFIKSSDDYSHGLNERIPVQSFYDGLEFWYRMMKDFSAPKG